MGLFFRKGETMTIYDIAREAGVSASTVSRVINDKPGIKEETRRRVQELLHKYSYSPNQAARGLVKQASGIIGILMADIRVSHHIDSAYIVEQEMTRQGYCCITMSTGWEEEKKAQYMKILEQRRVEGVVLMGSVFGTEQVEQSIKEHLSGVPTVIANGYLDLPNVYGILVDEQGGIEQCVRLLVQKGKKKLAFVMDSPTPSNYKKQQGFADGMRKQGWKGSLWLYEASEKEMAGGKEATLAILKDHPDVEGIVYSVDMTAVGGLNALCDMGIAVPKQVAVIGVNNEICGEISRPRLTSLDNQRKELSVTVARTLMDALEGKRVSHKIMLFTEITERESTP